MAKNKEPTFEEMLTQLESIVSAIEEGKIGLQQAIKEYEKGMKLIQSCRKVLTEAEARIQQLQVAEDGSAKTVPMEDSTND
ncbi:MAG: exodeoxyribonuclease VII small subunit [Planctomycetota bacterium]|nr:MAG: exodeoxyribonuclease VII small subunit [Planctomycetota bacterium]